MTLNSGIGFSNPEMSGAVTRYDARAFLRLISADLKALSFHRSNAGFSSFNVDVNGVA